MPGEIAEDGAISGAEPLARGVIGRREPERLGSWITGWVVPFTG